MAAPRRSNGGKSGSRRAIRRISKRRTRRSSSVLLFDSAHPYDRQQLLMTKRMNRRISIQLFSLVFSLMLGVSAVVSAQDLTITDAHVIPCNGSVIERGSIVVRAGSIVSVASGTPSAPNGTIIDAGGMNAMPGFIDAHRHINTGPDEKQQMQA